MTGPPVRDVSILGLGLLLTATISAGAGALITYGLGDRQTTTMLVLAGALCGIATLLDGLLLTILVLLGNRMERHSSP